MNRNYIFCLIGILSIYNVAFSMEPQEVKDFKAAYDAALKFEKAGEMDKALVEYGKAAEIKLPKSTGIFFDEYSNERKNQKLAKDKLEGAADLLTRANKMGEALKIYELAPVTFEDKIEFTKEVIEQELTRARTDIFPKALKFADEDNYIEASALLEATINDPNEFDVVKEAATNILTAIQRRGAKASKISEKALISALQNLKNGFVQVGKKLASK